MPTHTHSEQVDDYELLQLWQGEQLSAGDELVGRYFVHVVRLFELVASDSARPGLVSATFKRLREVGLGMPRPVSFRALVFALARNEFYRHLNLRTDAFDPDTDTLPDLQSNASSWLTNQVRDELLIQSLRELAVNQKLLIELYYWQGLSFDELAHVFECSSAQIEERLELALGMLAERLAQASPDRKIDVKRRLERLGSQLGLEGSQDAAPLPSSDGPSDRSSREWVAVHGSAVSRAEARQVLVALAKLYEEDTGDILLVGS